MNRKLTGTVQSGGLLGNLLIDEFRAGKIGKLTIDRLPSGEKPRRETADTVQTAAPEKEDDHADL